MIQLRSVHSPVDEDGGPRYLVDWKWPAGKHRQALSLAGWPRGLLPDAASWDRFHHDPLTRIEGFRKRYFRLLASKEKVWAPLARASQGGGITLLYDPKKARYTPAHFLKEFLELQIGGHHLPREERGKFQSPETEQVAPPVEKSVSRKRAVPPRPGKRFETRERLTYVRGPKRKVSR